MTKVVFGEVDELQSSLQHFAAQIGRAIFHAGWKLCQDLQQLSPGRGAGADPDSVGRNSRNKLQLLGRQSTEAVRALKLIMDMRAIVRRFSL